MRILITGAAGFLGSHLVDKLLADGHTVIGVDNFCTGRPQNIAHLDAETRFNFIEADICRPLSLHGPLDRLYNLASPASPIDYHRLGLETLDVGSTGVRSMLELAAHKKARFLQASTSECYGDPTVHPQTEDYYGNVNPVGPRSVYDESKRFAEALVTAFHRYRGLDVRIMRIFNTYGPRMRLDDGRVLPTFIDQVIRGQPLSVFGDGLQTRSFCYVDDLLEGMTRLMERDAGPQPVNIGNPQEITILEFAHELLQLMGQDRPITHLNLPKDDPKQRRPDITRARKLLDWEPRIDRKEGLKRTLEYFLNK